ncbi:MAG: prephenate dehydrogenase/arogenate dehydrogenase family protein [Acidobacteria bacterium]|nr:MAG: prephenate dehydrogenase/arogenate dehydrogenase family protein [Acidobacteriota bacterium]
MTEPSRRLPVLSEADLARASGAAPVFERIAVIGVGLVGGSIALAARKAWPAGLVIGVDRREVLEQAMVRHAVDVASHDPMIASEADLVILAAPVLENIRMIAELPRWLPRDAVITDVGATKRATVEAARSLPGRFRFVGGHPLAGMPRGGFEHARPDLFINRPWVLTPDPPPQGEEPDPVLSRLSAFVEGLGARPVVMPSPAEHDRLLAFLAQLPQLTVSALAAVVGQGASGGLHLAGRGLSDTTRLAASPASTWRDVCATNADAIAIALDRLIEVLARMRASLESGEAIESVFAAANEFRSQLETEQG